MEVVVAYDIGNRAASDELHRALGTWRLCMSPSSGQKAGVTGRLQATKRSNDQKSMSLKPVTTFGSEVYYAMLVI